MNPGELHSSSAVTRPIPPSRAQKLKDRLMKVVMHLYDNDPVYVNGETFTADEFRFLLTSIVEPEGKRK